jgi:hypothetical protein
MMLDPFLAILTRKMPLSEIVILTFYMTIELFSFPCWFSLVKSVRKECITAENKEKKESVNLFMGWCPALDLYEIIDASFFIQLC